MSQPLRYKAVPFLPAPMDAWAEQLAVLLAAETADGSWLVTTIHLEFPPHYAPQTGPGTQGFVAVLVFASEPAEGA